MTNGLAGVLRVEYDFVLRPVAIPADLRPLWRLGSICLILRNCWGSGATLKQLHVLNWALRDSDNRAVFVAALGEATPSRPIVRIEPSLNRAVGFAIGEKLIVRRTNRISLATRGIALAERIEADDESYVQEKAFFATIGRKLTATMVDRVLQWNTLA